MHEVKYGMGAFVNKDGNLVLHALGKDGAPERSIGIFDPQHAAWLRELLEDYEDKVNDA